MSLAQRDGFRWSRVGPNRTRWLHLSQCNNAVDIDGALDQFILWSGWIAALGIAIYEIAKAIRNRIRLQVSLAITDGDLCIGVHNWGRRPVTLVETGLRYANGMSSVLDDTGDLFPETMYRSDGRNICLATNEVMKELRSQNTEILYGYFVDEAGREYRTKPSDELKEHIRELPAKEKPSTAGAP